MIKKVLILPGLFLAILAFSACTSGTEKEVAALRALEKETIDKGGMLDQAMADSLVNAFVRFAEAHPKDSLAPVYLKKAAEVCMNSGKPQRAVAYFDKVFTAYPEYSKAPDCPFLKAFVLDSQLGDYGAASSAYKLFIEKFPKHEFADDAAAMIASLGKSPEELVKEFEEKNK